MAISTPMVNLPNYYMNGLLLTWTSVTTLTVSSGLCRDTSGENDIVLTQNVIINAFQTGALGLDTGTIAPSTAYAVYVIGNSYNNFPGDLNVGSALISASLSGPDVMPIGYDMYRRIGYVYTDGGSNFVEFWQEEAFNENKRRMWYDQPVQVLVSGGENSYTNVSIVNAVPISFPFDVTLKVELTPIAAGNAIQFAMPTSSPANPIAQLSGDAAGVVHVDSIGAVAQFAPDIAYQVQGVGTTANVFVTSYLDTLQEE